LIAAGKNERIYFRAMKILIIGYSQPGQMGSYLASAADKLRLNYQIMDMSGAETNSRVVQSFYWRLRNKRPANLAWFASQVLQTCAVTRPTVAITTGGRAPLEGAHIQKLRSLGITVMNYSTDDPWNPVLRAPWFISALPYYNTIFTPRRSNLDDFYRCGVRDIHYLPFAYDPEVHRPWPEDRPPGAASDALFVGGCDAERLPLISAFAESGLNLALFGRYWNNHSKTRAHWRGVVDQDTIRAASATAAICLCLVRRANRDGHVMRSFEAAAIGGCILAEDTADHRELFGPEDLAVRYFKTIPEMVRQAKILMADPNLRWRLTLALRERMATRSDTYADRLAAMLQLSNVSSSRTVASGQRVFGTNDATYIGRLSE
jgi:spore maturation protein CgeB